jgi:hypothetical protein
MKEGLTNDDFAATIKLLKRSTGLEVKSAKAATAP